MAAPIYRGSRAKFFSWTICKHDFGPYLSDRELFYEIALIIVRLPCNAPIEFDVHIEEERSGQTIFVIESQKLYHGFPQAVDVLRIKSQDVEPVPMELRQRDRFDAKFFQDRTEEDGGLSMATRFGVTPRRKNLAGLADEGNGGGFFCAFWE